MGTPAELVHHPADGFVITFTGGNLLEGTADGRDTLTRLLCVASSNGGATVAVPLDGPLGFRLFGVSLIVMAS